MTRLGLPEQVKNILVLNTTHIGTLLCTTPLLLRLRAHYPKAEITVLIVKRNAVLREYLERQGFRTLVIDNYSRTNFYPLLLRLLFTKFKKFDLGVCGLEPRKKDHLLLSVLCRYTLGYGQNNWHSRLLSQNVPFNKKAMQGMHQAQFICNIFDQMPLRVSEYPNLTDGTIKEKHVVPRLFVQVRNNRPTSQLNIKTLASLLNGIWEEVPFEVVVNDYENSEAVKEFCSLISVPFKVSVTKNFEDLLRVLFQCDACFVGDGGTSHIAAALHVPTFAVFGETSPIEWMPLNTKYVRHLFHSSDVNKIPTDEIRKGLLNLLQFSSEKA